MIGFCKQREESAQIDSFFPQTRQRVKTIIISQIEGAKKFVLHCQCHSKIVQNYEIVTTTKHGLFDQYKEREREREREREI